MTTPTDGEWMSAAEARQFLHPHVGAHAICSRAHAGLIKARAKLFISQGMEQTDVEVPREFWAKAKTTQRSNWVTGDFQTVFHSRVNTMQGNQRAERRLQAFGVEFRRQDIEGLKPASTAANLAPPSAPAQRPASSDGEWMSAQEALQFLQLPQADALKAICDRAQVGLIQARAKLFIAQDNEQRDVDVSREFWTPKKEGAVLTANWLSGDFETWMNHPSYRLKAFGVTFRRSDIEGLKPAASGASASSLIEPISPIEPVASRKVFLVHGRDEHAKNEVALFLRKIGLEEIVLHQRPNRGRNLLTKFQEEAEGSSFAVILMTPDDDGGIAGELQQKRARQNVVFELGFFIGKLEAPHVAALVVPDVEKPSDFDGICWIEFGRGTNWKNELARELKEAGVPFDLDAIFHA